VKWILAALGLIVLDRLLLGAESRGWVYYRRRKASPGTLSRALVEMHATVEPAKAHVAEARQELREEDDDGAPPSLRVRG
jgi:hypothetical protein